MQDDGDRLDSIEGALTDSALAPMVDLVLHRDGGTYRAASARGAVTFRHDDGGTRVMAVEGQNPLADDDTLVG